MVITEQPIVGFIAGFSGMAIPVIYWLVVRARRLAAMRRLMPDALDQLADALYGGLTLDQAAEMVSLQTPAPLKQEFAHMVSLLEMGQAPAAVMDRMARRVPVPEFRLFATAVQVHRLTGGNLAQLTTRLAASARDRLEWDRHLGAQTVTGRWSAIGMVLCGIIGFTVLSFTRPQYTEFFVTSGTGQRLLFCSFALMVIGAIWIARVVRVRY
jgi:tight adherence protein B